MNTTAFKRACASLLSLLLALPQVSYAQSDCSVQVDALQRHLGAFDTEARLVGPGFLRAFGAGAALTTYRKRLDGGNERAAGIARDIEDAKNELVAWDGRVTLWADGISRYQACLQSAGCSIGAILEEFAASNRPLSDWLKGLNEEGLDKATEKVDRAASLLKTFRSNAGTLGSGTMGSVMACLTGSAPRPVSPPASSAPPASTGSVTIDHKAVGCAMAEKFPKFDAKFAPPDTVAVARVVFQGASSPEWFSVAMKGDGSMFSGVLPKPKKILKSFRYYIEVTDKSLGTSRTPDYTTNVITDTEACPKSILAAALGSASILLQGPAGAVLPAGFASSGVVMAAGGAVGSTSVAGAAGASSAGAAGGLGTTAIVGIAGGVAAVGAVAAKGGGGGGGTVINSGPGPTPVPTPVPTPTPAPTPVPTPTPAVVTVYDGNYRGSFNGTFGGSPATGSVALSVSNGNITVTDPGSGSGTVSSTGSATFSGKLNVEGVACSFTGSFSTNGTAGGNWSCSGGGFSGNGSWNASR